MTNGRTGSRQVVKENFPQTRWPQTAADFDPGLIANLTRPYQWESACAEVRNMPASGPRCRNFVVQQVGSHLEYTGRGANASGNAARDPLHTFRSCRKTTAWSPARRGSRSEQLSAERHCLRCKQCGLIVQATIAYRVDRHDGDPRKFWFGEPRAHCKQQPSRFFETDSPDTG